MEAVDLLDNSVSFAIAQSGQEPVHYGPASGTLRFHSAAKPFQMLSFLRENYENPFCLSEPERVILASSHLGQDIHIHALDSILKKTSIPEELLIVPESEPTGKLANDFWRTRGTPKRKIYHPCAGKHLGFILQALDYGEEPAYYYSLESAVQSEALQNIQHFTKARRKIKIAQDFCGVPTYEVTLSEIATAYMNLVSSEPLVTQLISKHGRYIEGDGALATDLMTKFPVIAKTSINFMVAIGIPQYCMGIALKAKSWSQLRTCAEQILVGMI